MSPIDLLHHYGYFAIVVGTFFEGEVVMIAAGILAAAGVLSLPWVMASSVGGIFASDTVCFLLGRFAGCRLATWFPSLYARMGGVFRLIERHDKKLIVFFQFFPGLCTVAPMAFGMTDVSIKRFLALDFIGNLVWTLVFSVCGYLFGTAFVSIALDIHHWMTALMIVTAVAGLAWGVWKVRQSLMRSIE